MELHKMHNCITQECNASAFTAIACVTERQQPEKRLHMHNRISLRACTVRNGNGPISTAYDRAIADVMG